MRSARVPRASSNARRKRPWSLLAAAVLLPVVIGAGIYMLRSRGSAPTPTTNDPGVSHIHGLGINPADGDLYAATHMGVFHIRDDGRATRVADRYQDTMGFTVAGPDHFIASGHPDLREELPSLLGLIESKDAAKTWNKKSLLGKADFHALRYAHGRIYGYDSTGSAFMVSKDGRRWDTRSQPTIGDFAVSPEDPDVLIATTPDGLERSKDGGRSWKVLESPPQPTLVVWPSPDEMWVADFTGRVHFSDDGGKTWEARGRLTARPEALLATEEHLYMAIADGIYVSRDGGEKWDLFFREDRSH